MSTRTFFTFCLILLAVKSKESLFKKYLSASLLRPPRTDNSCLWNEIKDFSAIESKLQFHVERCSFKDLSVFLGSSSTHFHRRPPHGPKQWYMVVYQLIDDGLSSSNITFESLNKSSTVSRMESTTHVRIFGLIPGSDYVLCAKADRSGCIIVQIKLDVGGGKEVQGISLIGKNRTHVTIGWNPVNIFHSQEEYEVSAENADSEKGLYYLKTTSDLYADIPVSKETIISICISLHIGDNIYPYSRCQEIATHEQVPVVNSKLSWGENKTEVLIKIDANTDSPLKLQVEFFCYSTSYCKYPSEWNDPRLGCPPTRQMTVNETEEVAIEVSTSAMWISATFQYSFNDANLTVGSSNLLPPKSKVTKSNFEIDTKKDSFEIIWKRNEIEWLKTSIILECDDRVALLSKLEYYGCEMRFRVGGLKPYTSHNCIAHISTEKKGEFSASMEHITLTSIRTRPGECEAVNLIEVRNSFNNNFTKELIITWVISDNLSGVIEKVSFNIVDPRNHNEIFKQMFEDCTKFTKSCKSSGTYTMQRNVPKLKPDKQYWAHLSCKYRDGYTNGTIRELIFTTGSKVPEIKDKILYLLDTRRFNDPYNQYTVYINTANMDYKSGNIIKRVAIYAVKGYLASPERGSFHSEPKRITRDNKPTDNEEEHTLDVPLDIDEFNITSLESQTYYSVKLRYFTSVGYADSKMIHFRTAEEPLDVWGVASAMLALLVLLLTVAFFANPVPKYDKRFITLDNTVTIHERVPINLNDFVQTIERLVSGKELEQHFKELARISPERDCKVAKYPENEYKNRYMNILPFDFSRVVLNQVPGCPYSDFINASYIHGYKIMYKFIASQGPTDTTIQDFWRMIWEKDVKTIVMLTNCIEGRKEKCSVYWPDPSKNVAGVAKGQDDDKISIETLSEETARSEGYIMRKFKLTKTFCYFKIKRSISKIVTQYQYKTWPDFSCPNRPSQLVNFILNIRQNTINDDSHILVHCSAGVGRTGTYILIDCLIDEFLDSSTREVDIYNYVHKMRNFRPAMIQTLAQYVFVYKCAALIYLGLDSWNGKIEPLEELENKYSFLQSRKRALSFQQTISSGEDGYGEELDLVPIDEGEDLLPVNEPAHQDTEQLKEEPEFATPISIKAKRKEDQHVASEEPNKDEEIKKDKKQITNEQASEGMHGEDKQISQRNENSENDKERDKKMDSYFETDF